MSQQNVSMSLIPQFFVFSLGFKLLQIRICTQRRVCEIADPGLELGAIVGVGQVQEMTP